MRKLMENVFEPLIGRVGTAIGFALVGYGVADVHANMIGMGVAAAIFVGVDLVTRKIWKDR